MLLVIASGNISEREVQEATLLSLAGGVRRPVCLYYTCLVTHGEMSPGRCHRPVMVRARTLDCAGCRTGSRPSFSPAWRESLAARAAAPAGRAGRARPTMHAAWRWPAGYSPPMGGSLASLLPVGFLWGANIATLFETGSLS